MIKPLIFILACLLSAGIAAQESEKTTVQSAPNRASLPAQGYPITNRVTSPAMAAFYNDFELMNVGFMHVYIDPTLDAKETYLMRGKAASGTTLALLPAKFQRMAKTTQADVYAIGAIAGVGESLYLVRMDGSTEDRIEMFAERDGKIKHLKTLASRKCTSGACLQTDAFLTDVDGDGTVELIQQTRRQNSRGKKDYKPVAYFMHDKKKRWVKTRKLELPLTSMTLYDASQDQ